MAPSHRLAYPQWHIAAESLVSLVECVQKVHFLISHRYQILNSAGLSGACAGIARAALLLPLASSNLLGVEN
ncbi:hypothetical protein DMN77_22990 [Paenibacillus sp. 79R4]|nr:hypothetical protein [Paenibacillus sp. 79R4]